MIRFINIDTNRVFNGDMPYIHWFEGQQSVDLIYTQRICVLSDTETIHVSVPENPVFHILDVSKIGQDEVVMNQITYQDINNMYCYELDDKGIPYDQYYVHMLYFTASSSDAMEARENFFIDNQPYMMGADFYPEREELKINLANFGIEIPESVQRAIYPSNVHEEAKDNILLNRKYKELMMDYMTILGNKGSYESLLNSLHWFEYGDLLTIKEFWKHKEWERIIYNDQEFTQVLSEKSKHLLTNFAKTTYMGIYLAMQVEKRSKDADQDGDVIYDQETYTEHSRYDAMVNARTEPALPRDLVSKRTQRDTLTQHGTSGTFVSEPLDPHTGMVGANWKQSSEELATVERLIAEPVPALEKASYIWGRTDLAIKMALLGNFYETYFMPVHLDLIHATIEDIVYTNAIKVIPQGYLSRTDHIEHLHDVLCNISNGQTFLLGDVTVQADNQTPFHVNWKDTWNGTTYDYDLHTIIGVDEAFDHIIHDDDELKTWAVNRFQGVGAVIPMDFVIRASERVFGDHGEIVSQDLIHKVTMTINDGSEEWPVMEFNKLFEPDVDNNIHIKFNLLCTKDAEYDLRMQFYNTNGESYYKRIHFVVLDTRRAGLTVYKLKSIPKHSTIESLKLQGGKEAGDYLFSHFNLAEIQKYYTQYLPATTNQYLSTAVDGPGARLNHMLVVKGVYSVNTDPSNPTEQDFFDRLATQSPNTVTVLRNNYHIYPRYDGVDDGRIQLDTSRAKYYVLVSKEFDYILSQNHISNILRLEAGNKVILRNEYVFIPQKHYLEQLDKGKSINKYNKEDFTIYRDETACVVPDIRYLKYIESYEWVFRNASTLEDINLNSIKEPIVAPTKQVPLPAGYYDIIFRYKLANDPEGRINEVSLKSAFIQSDEYLA